VAILQCYIKIRVVAALRRRPRDVPRASATTGTLFVVATPIGNLEDITLRALRVLREVAVVAAEDTRRTSHLLRHFDIATPLLSLHEHNEVARVPRIIEHLRNGRSVALVSDAGTPGISDPGAAVVRAVRTAGFPVVPVPGPSAVAAAISVGGLEEARFAFAGFPPIKSKDRKRWSAWVASAHDLNVVFFEAPHRITKTLAELATILGDRPILGGREVTKVHEEWAFGTANDLCQHFGDAPGEFVFIIPAKPIAVKRPPAVSDDHVLSLFGQITDTNGLDRRAAVRAVAETLQLSRKDVYAAIERAKKLG
jgi:16S rRNA (cytidine1402-2'-O)-methyltransferase